MADFDSLTLLSPLFAVDDRLLAERSWQAAMVLAGTLGALGTLNLAAPRLGLMDHPDGERKRHDRPVPLTGGLAILAGVGLGAIVGMSAAATAREVVALLAIVAVIHAFDDQASARPGLSARQRLAIDSAVALAFILVTGAVIDTIGTVGGVDLRLGLAAIPFTVFIYLALTNAYNMVDGLDGLALSQFLIGLVAVLAWHVASARGTGMAVGPAVPIVLAAVVVLAANVGILGRFLRCFLGDSGARLLAFFLVYLLVADAGRLFSPPGALFFVAVPILDLCAVVGERLRAGGAPMGADRRHLHHLLVDAGFGPRRVVLIMGLLSVGFVGVHALLQAAEVSDLGLAGVFVGLAGVYWLTRRSLVAQLRRRVPPHPVIGPAE